jgi:NitT/TauT family transport system substrate-binding protein
MLGAFAPFTTQALKRSGSKVLFSSKDFPGAIPDHLTVSGSLIKERPADVQKLVNAWFMTLDYIKANPDKATDIMAKRAGVSKSEYKEYDAGTTIFSLEQNISAFSDGNDITHLNFAAKEIAEFMLANGFIEKPLALTGIFDPAFVKAFQP